MNSFDKGILNILNKVSYEMFVIQQEFTIECSCVDFTTKQAKDNCPKCLGTGKKIRIKKVMGASQNRKTSFRVVNVGETATTSAYYLKADIPIYQDNILVNGTDVDIVQRVEKLRSNHLVPVYFKCVASPKKVNTRIFLQNFNKIIGSG